MSLFRDNAVVLRRHKLGEADRILTLLTRHHGVVRAVAKGIRRTSSRFGGRLEPGMHVDVQLATGRNLHVVTQVVTLDAFAEAFTRDYSDYTSATVALETAERMCSEEGEPATQQYLLLVGALRSLAGHAHDRGLVLNAYLLRALAVAGYAPSFDTCSRCHAPGPHAAFNPAAGGVVCAACRPSSVAMPARETVLLLAALLSGQWEVADASGPSERNEADRLVAGYLRWHLERQLRSLPLLDTWRDPKLRPDGPEPPAAVGAGELTQSESARGLAGA